MGYDLNKFVSNDIPNHLICFICKLVLQDPLQSECEHYFCNQCITIYLTNQTHCPHFEDDSLSVKSDKKKSPLRKMSFRKIIGKSPKENKLPILKLSDLKNLPDNLIEELNSLKVNCDFNSNGCKEELNLSKLKEHVRNCKFIDLKIEEEENKTTTEEIKNLEDTKKESVNTEQMNKQESDQIVKVTSSDEQTRVDSIDETNVKHKDSENKSGEEEVGSDDFVVIPKTIKASSSSTKSTESVQTNSSTMISSKENVNKDENQENVEKKKKKKKKKKSANKQSDEDTVSLKGPDSGQNSEVSSKTQSKESLVESEEVKRALKDAETKSENLRLINSQLLGQIKKLKDEKEEFTKKLQSQLDTACEVEELKNKIQNLENENKSQASKIVKLIQSNDQMNNFILTLRDEQCQIKDKYNSTLNEVQKTLNFVKSCKQSI